VKKLVGTAFLEVAEEALEMLEGRVAIGRVQKGVKLAQSLKDEHEVAQRDLDLSIRLDRIEAVGHALFRG
jgi:hypothetical protein